jgi:hypothetical protein
MTDTGIFATTAEVQRKVGSLASSTANTETYINQYMTEAESSINALTNFNWSDNYSSLNVDVKGILKETASDIAACYVINFDIGAFGSSTAQTMLNFLIYKIERNIEILKEQKNKDFVQGA